MKRIGSSAWGVLWHSRNRRDGLSEYLCLDDCTFVPVLFRTRAGARDYIEHHFGYIRWRRDLRAEPHGWRTPRTVRVKVTLARAT